MESFFYKAYDKEFNIIKGFIEEKDMTLARDRIKDRGLNIIYIKKRENIFKDRLGKKKLSYKEISSICSGLGIIINAGVNILSGLDILKAENRKEKELFDKISMGIREGSTLGEAMEESKGFPSLVTDMVKAGELSGNVDEVLFNLEDYYRREDNLRSRLIGAAIYPLILIFVVIAMIIFFDFFIFPNLLSVFEDLSSLPLITRALISALKFLGKYYVEVVIASLILIFLLFYYRDNEHYKEYVHRKVLDIPVIGQLQNYVISTRFSKTMEILIRSGIHISSALESIEHIIENSFISKKIDRAREEVIRGSELSGALGRENIFDPLIIEFIKIGEESGRLEEMLKKMSEVYDKRLELYIGKITSLVEPVFTLVIGIIAGIIIVAIALPIMQISGKVG